MQCASGEWYICWWRWRWPRTAFGRWRKCCRRSQSHRQWEWRRTGCWQNRQVVWTTRWICQQSGTTTVITTNNGYWNSQCVIVLEALGFTIVPAGWDCRCDWVQCDQYHAKLLFISLAILPTHHGYRTKISIFLYLGGFQTTYTPDSVSTAHSQQFWSNAN